MKHLVFDVRSLTELKAVVQKLANNPVIAEASTLLLHVFTCSIDPQYVVEMRQIIKSALPKAIIVGASAGGQIIKDKICTQTTALSVMCFEKAKVYVVSCNYGKFSEQELRDKLQNFVTQYDQIQGVEVLANVKGLDNLSFLAALDTLPNDVPVFGCGADADDNDPETIVFDSENVYAHGAVAVVYCGEQLRVHANISVGWKTLGKSMLITKTGANDMAIETIDNKPAVDIYKKYLKIENSAQFAFLVQEFPLVVNRHGNNVARVAVTSTPEGVIRLGAKVRVGEAVRIGYADPQAIIDAVRLSLQKIAIFQPQAILSYSCITRKVFIKEYANEDNKPFNKLAPVCGFHTFGEIYRENGHVDVLNCTLVSVAMREGDISAQQISYPPKQDELQGHMSLVQRLVRFVEATSLELEEANQQLSIVATHDPLTKLLNRGEIENRFKKELLRLNRGDENVAIIMVDIDNFKHINDTMGHAVGDAVLRKVAAILQACVREYDLVGRWGGEEFLILLLGYKQVGPAEVAERIRNQVAETDFGVGHAITVSMGVTVAKPNESMMKLYLRADAALYDAKDSGKNCVIQK